MLRQWARQTGRWRETNSSSVEASGRLHCTPKWGRSEGWTSPRHGGTFHCSLMSMRGARTDSRHRSSPRNTPAARRRPNRFADFVLDLAFRARTPSSRELTRGGLVPQSLLLFTFFFHFSAISQNWTQTPVGEPLIVAFPLEFTPISRAGARSSRRPRARSRRVTTGPTLTAKQPPTQGKSRPQQQPQRRTESENPRKTRSSRHRRATFSLTSGNRADTRPTLAKQPP